jgi:hypothetical protein
VTTRTPTLPVRLARALARGAKWNWVYWRATVRVDEREVLVAAVPHRVVQAVERGELTRLHAAQLLASRAEPSLDGFTPYVPLWAEALAQLLALRVDARRAALLGQTAHDLALAGRWAEAFEAAWGAAEIERSYAGRPTKWRSLLCLVAQELVRSGHVRATTDPRVRSAAEAPAGTPRPRHEGRGRRQRS